MKKSKLLSAFVSSVIALNSASIFISNAENTAYPEYNFHEAIASLGDDKVIFTAEGSWNYTAVMTSEKIYYLCYFPSPVIRIDVTSDAALPSDEINEKVYPDFSFNKGGAYDDYDYMLSYRKASFETDLPEEDALNIVKQYDGIVSMKKQNAVASYNGEFDIYGISINSDLSKDEIIQRYSELDLAESENTDDDYTYSFDFSTFKISPSEPFTINNLKNPGLEYTMVSDNEIDFNFYDVIKKLSEDNDIISWNFKGNYQTSEEMNVYCNYSMDTEYLYIAQITGDTNIDGEISIADSVAVTAYVSNKEKNPMEEQSALNGDVFNTGDGLNASDAFMIQQYATGQIDKL